MTNQQRALLAYKKRRKHQKIIAVILVVVAILTIPSAFYLDKIHQLQFSDGKSVGDLTDTNMDELDVSELASVEYIEGGYGLPSGKPYSDKNVINILLLGTDDRTENFSDNARSDSMILVSVNTKEDTVKLVSFERGTGVPVLDGEYKGQWDWLTHCFRYGGSDLVLREIQTAYLLDCSYYVRTNIKALVKIVDAVDGIDIELSQEEADYINGNDPWKIGYANSSGDPSRLQTVTKGKNHLNGVTAIVYARTRKIDNDWGRMQRQRKVISAIINQMKGLNVSQLNNLLNEVLPCFQTNMKTGEITSLLLQAPGVLSNLDDIDTLALPADGTYGSMKGMEDRSLFAVNFEENIKILNKYLYGVTDEDS